MRAAIAIAAAGLVLGAEAKAFAKDGERIAVGATGERATLGLRLGAEIAELGYKVVPVSSDETHDGAVLALALQRVDAIAALTLEDEGNDVVACVVERASMRRTCRQVASGDEKLDDGAVATKSAELLRALLVDQPGAAIDPVRKEIQPKTGPSSDDREVGRAPVVLPRARNSIIAGRFGPGILLSSGVPAEVVAAVGIEWISVPHFGLGVDAALPIAGSTLQRSEGTASVRVSTVTLHADGRAHVGRFEGELGAGLGLMWLQASGTVAQQPVAGSDGAAGGPFVGVNSSIVDPIAVVHAAGSFFLDHAIALRVDVAGDFALRGANIVFGSDNVASVGRPLVLSTLSLAIGWP